MKIKPRKKREMYDKGEIMMDDYGVTTAMHIPSFLVVNRWATDERAAHTTISGFDMMFG